MKNKRRLAILLTLAMIITMIPLPVFAMETNMLSDMPENWSRAAIQNAVLNGLLKGDDGKIHPNDYLTRAQMAAIINRAFGAAEQAALKDYKDVPISSWYYGDMAKAVQMGTFMGNGGLLEPDKNITREEAFAVIARAFKLSGGSTEILNRFADREMVSKWAAEETASLTEAGYVAGSDGMLNPKAYITRAEFAQMMDNLIKQYIKEAGTYTDIASGNVMINAPGATLKNVVVKGDLIIGDGVGEGSVTLDNVDITGRMVVRGGGPNSIIVKGDSSINSIIIAKVNGMVRICSEDGTEIGTVIIDGYDDVIVEGNYESVIISSNDITVTATEASIENALIEGNNSILIVKEGSYIETVTVNGNGASVKGEGNVDEVLVYANNVSVETMDTAVTAAENAGNVTAVGKTVTPGTTVITRLETPRSSNSKGVTLKAATPTANPQAGEVEIGTTVVLATTTSGAAIYYTTDGSTPTAYSALYAEAISITGDTVIKAIAIKTGMKNSDVLTAAYTTALNKAATPTANPQPGEVEIGTTVALTTTTTGAAIHYTTDGSTPTSESGEYSTPIAINGNTTIKAIAVKSGMENSYVLTAVYTIMNSDFAGGAGTEENPYQIATAYHLDNVRNYQDAHFIQIADIDLQDYLSEGGDGYNEGEGWVPIGGFDSDKRFTGSYDGNGFVINNLTINRNEMYQGMFGYVSNAVIKNVIMVNVDVTGNMWTAGLAAFQDGGQITNSSSEGTITGTGNLGGLVAQSSGATYSALIEGCSTEGQVLTIDSTGTPNYTGGLVGRTNSSVVSKSFSLADVTGVNIVGGLVGLSFNSTIEESYAAGNISGNETIGGVAGEATGTISDVYYCGIIDGNNYIGGLVGKYSSLTIENGYCVAEKSEYNEYYPYHHYYGLYNYSSSLVSSRIYNASVWDNDYDYNGFYERTVDNMKKLFTYKNFDFQNIWGHNAYENNGYPFLRWQSYDHVPDFAGGAGTQADPFRVATAEQLDKVRYYPESYFLQTANIDLTEYLAADKAGYNSGEGWVPIGTSSKPFAGSYDGNEFSITGLWINRPNAYYQGLFGYLVSGATIIDVHLIGTEIYADEYIGALAAYSAGEISGCSAESVNIMCEDMYAGGLVGQNSGTITDCSTTGMVRADYEYAGGLVAYNYGNASSGFDGYIGDSFSEADVTYLNADQYELEGAGGLVGYNSSGTIENSYATGQVTGHESVGGLAGENWQGTVSGCYATGNVSSISDYEGYQGYYAGGLIGENTYLSSVVNCHAEGNVTGHTDVGGLVGYNSALVQKCFAKGDVSGVDKVGGLVGNSSGTIENTYATGSAAGTHYIGGLVGYLDYSYGTITNSYAAGLVATASFDRGGLHGGSVRPESVFNCYYDRITTEQNDTGKGVLLTTEEMTDQGNFIGWDFTEATGIWIIDSDPASYPYFQWQTENVPAAPIESPTLLGLWSFDEGTGTTASDGSGNNNHGTLQGSTWTYDRESAENKALEFGVNKWVDIPDTIKPEKITLSAWIYITGTDGSAAPIFSAEKGLGATGFAYRLQITPDCRLRMEAIAPYSAGGARVSTSMETLNLNQWYHVAGTYDGINTKIYIDGSLAKSDNHGTFINLKTNEDITAAIGHLQDWGVQWFRGTIDDARIYDGVLSQKQIQSIIGPDE